MPACTRSHHHHHHRCYSGEYPVFHCPICHYGCLPKMLGEKSPIWVSSILVHIENFNRFPIKMLGGCDYRRNPKSEDRYIRENSLLFSMCLKFASSAIPVL